MENMVFKYKLKHEFHLDGKELLDVTVIELGVSALFMKCCFIFHFHWGLDRKF